jgi:ABC-type glycerol-3-phosphate transport system substrate-binding protein
MGRGAGALALVLVLAGCGGGGQSSASQQRANDRLDALELKITTQYESAATPYNNYLEQASRQYVALVHKYAHQLGPKAARQRLMAMGNQIAEFCTACAGDLYDAAAGY